MSILYVVLECTLKKSGLSDESGVDEHCSDITREAELQFSDDAHVRASLQELVDLSAMVERKTMTKSAF